MIGALRNLQKDFRKVDLRSKKDIIDAIDTKHNIKAVLLADTIFDSIRVFHQNTAFFDKMQNILYSAQYVYSTNLFKKTLSF